MRCIKLQTQSFHRNASLTAGSLVQQEKGTPHFSRLGLLSVQLK